MEEDEKLSKNINRLRRRLGLSQEALAERANCSHGVVFRAENKGTVPRGNNLRAIAKALGVTTTDLFADVDDAPKITQTAVQTRNELIQSLFEILLKLSESEIELLIRLAKAMPPKNITKV